MQDLTLIEAIMAQLLENTIIAYRDSNMASEQEEIDFHNAQWETLVEAQETILGILIDYELNTNFTDRIKATIEAILKQEMK
jgi:hypothetical protein